MNYIKRHKPDSKVLQFIKQGHYLQSKTHGEIQIDKEDIDTPYYWICKWKDEMLEYTKKIRPIPTYKNDYTTMYNPINILIKLTNMIPWWMQNNKDMNLYVIKINFIKPKDNLEISYIDMYNKINKCYRTIDDGKPCCLPCK